MQKIIINGDGKRYLSEIMDFSINGLPHGILNKRLTDVGGTFCAINSKSNYIVVVPFIDLTTSITSDTNNKYPVYACHGKSLKMKFNEYVAANNIKKIAVTYDSLPKLINWLKSNGEKIEDYKLLIDEYHLILEDMDYRDEAINGLIDNVNKFSHYTFLSATPVDSDFEFDFLQELPHYEVNWGDVARVQPVRLRTPNVYKACCNLIEEFQGGLELDTIDGNVEQVKELHIFLNSVKGIATICSSIGLTNEDVKIVCADTIRNNMIMTNYEISSITTPNKSINFYTKKGFQGCNVFSNNALVVVLSDAKAEHTLIDIETTLTQIQGRIRFNDKSRNIFRHKIYHIYSTNRRVMSDDDFQIFMAQKETESIFIYEDLMSRPVEVRKIYVERLNVSSDLLSISGDTIIYNERKKHLFAYKHKLKKSYANGYEVRAAYLKNSKMDDSKQYFVNYDNIVLSKIGNIPLEELYTLYLESNDKQQYLIEYPEFEDYEKYLTVKNMNSLRWNKDRINKSVADLKALDVVHRKVSFELDNGFISLAALKALYQKILSELSINIAGKAVMIEDNRFVDAVNITKRINSKVVKGYEIQKNMFQINMN